MKKLKNKQADTFRIIFFSFVFSLDLVLRRKRRTKFVFYEPAKYFSSSSADSLRCWSELSPNELSRLATKPVWKMEITQSHLNSVTQQQIPHHDSAGFVPKPLISSRQSTRRAVPVWVETVTFLLPTFARSCSLTFSRCEISDSMVTKSNGMLFNCCVCECGAGLFHWSQHSWRWPFFPWMAAQNKNEWAERSRRWREKTSRLLHKSWI